MTAKKTDGIKAALNSSFSSLTFADVSTIIMFSVAVWLKYELNVRRNNLFTLPVK